MKSYDELLIELKELVKRDMPDVEIVASQPLSEDMYRADPEITLKFIVWGNNDKTFLHYDMGKLASIREHIVEMFIGRDNIRKFDETDPERCSLGLNMIILTHAAWTDRVKDRSVYEGMTFTMYDGKGNWYV